MSVGLEPSGAGWNRCPICGHIVPVEWSPGIGDIPCPRCGSLLWPNVPKEDCVRRLEKLGAFASFDVEGEVRTLRLVGDVYTNKSIDWLATITGLEMLDVRDTKITASGAAKLRLMMPKTKIVSDRFAPG